MNGGKLWISHRRFKGFKRIAHPLPEWTLIYTIICAVIDVWLHVHHLVTQSIVKYNHHHQTKSGERCEYSSRAGV